MAKTDIIISIDELLADLNFDDSTILKDKEIIDADPLKLSTEQKEAIAAELVSLKAAKETIEEREKGLRKLLTVVDLGKGEGATGTFTLHQDAGVSASITRPWRVDPEKVQEKLPYDYAIVVDEVQTTGPFGTKKIVKVKKYPNRIFYKVTPDATQIKSRLPEDDVVDPETGDVTQLGWHSVYTQGDAQAAIR